MSVKPNSIVLLHGRFETAVLDRLKGSTKGTVFVLEGRPTLDASRHTCRELLKRKVKPTIIADNMAGFLFFRDFVKEVWIASAHADDQGVVGPIGSSILAVLAKKHRVPVKVYPGQNTDKKMMGSQSDILCLNGVRVAPRGVKGYVPLIEWFPSTYITKSYV